MRMMVGFVAVIVAVDNCYDWKGIKMKKVQDKILRLRERRKFLNATDANVLR